MPDALPAPTFPFTSIRAGSPNTLLGTDVLVNNVVSMHIRVMDGRGKFYDRFTRIPNPSPLPLYLVESGLAPPTTYVNGGATEGFRLDTANPFIPTYPIGVQMRAVQIKLRVYDTKNHLTRQMTMTFDL